MKVTEVENSETTGGGLFARSGVALLFWKLAASGLVPAKWVGRDLPPASKRRSRDGVLELEIVSHCWRYPHLLVYQLSSLVLYPPERARVRMTVYYSLEDEKTVELLEFFARQKVAGVAWDFRALPKERLFRRAIGRNHAALKTRADWIWFTDCDVLFGKGCLDTLADALQNRTDALVFPRQELCSELLPEESDMLSAGRGGPRVLGIDADNFEVRIRTRATGPLQITHGDVARATGYCKEIGYYQLPAERWCKAHEDRAFRWLLRSQGVPLDVPSVFRVQHAVKGRYNGNPFINALRSRIRKITQPIKDLLQGQGRS